MARFVVVELERNSPKWTKVIDEIVRIEKKIFPKHESLARSFDEELKKRNSGLLFSEVDGDGDGHVAGYVMYSWPSSLCASITKLAVKENFRGQGYGEELLKAAIEKCRTRRVHRISLHVDPLRTPAMTLYKKLGFQVDNLIEGYYAPDRHAYRMYLDFESN
ncbi:Ribosomal-protein-alanine acetyltransferase [Actinidia chinensis var. chinensis]|uniref:Ribosomal-protein-alanine acetyltransferase n=1 Tax=Actinidia chinensis var. chinensis TaxID=1590841 RepID=A0A2R6QTQ3_ACTCC|nr:Ribosomal-protein-alanine acetyltransferase [Actinidia chinensis var. chinensis]